MLGGEIGQLIGRTLDIRAGALERQTHRLDRALHFARRARDPMFRQQQDVEFARIAHICARQWHVGQHVEQRGKVVGVAGHRPGYAEWLGRGIAARKEMPAEINRAIGRLVAPHAAESGRAADRAGDIRSNLRRNEAGRQRRRRAAGRTTADPRRIERIVGPPIDRVVGLNVSQRRRDIGLAQNDRARRLQPPDSGGILMRDMAGVFGNAPAGRQAGDVEAFLDRHRQAEQRRGVACRQPLVRRPGLQPRPVEIADHDGVDRAVARLDPRDRRLGLGDRAGLAAPDRGDGFECAPHHPRLSVIAE